MGVDEIKRLYCGTLTSEEFQWVSSFSPEQRKRVTEGFLENCRVAVEDIFEGDGKPEAIPEFCKCRVGAMGPLAYNFCLDRVRDALKVDKTKR